LFVAATTIVRVTSEAGWLQYVVLIVGTLLGVVVGFSLTSLSDTRRERRAILSAVEDVREALARAYFMTDRERAGSWFDAAFAVEARAAIAIWESERATLARAVPNYGLSLADWSLLTYSFFQFSSFTTVIETEINRSVSFSSSDESAENLHVIHALVEKARETLNARFPGALPESRWRRLKRSLTAAFLPKKATAVQHAQTPQTPAIETPQPSEAASTTDQET